MTYSEAVEFVEKNKEMAAVAVNKAEKEIFVVEFYKDEDSEEGGYVGVHYEKDLGLSSGGEASLEIDECLEEFPYVNTLEFIDILGEKASEIYGYEFDHQLEKLGANKK